MQRRQGRRLKLGGGRSRNLEIIPSLVWLAVYICITLGILMSTLMFPDMLSSILRHLPSSAAAGRRPAVHFAISEVHGTLESECTCNSSSDQLHPFGSGLQIFEELEIRVIHAL